MNYGRPEVIYEDNHLVAVNKRPGEMVQGDKTGDEPLSERVKQYLKEEYGKPGAVFLGTIHRIDRPVSGVVLFARTSKALERMNELFRERQVKKIYHAIVERPPDPHEGHLIHYLIKDEAKNKSRAYTEERPGALRCELKYVTLAHSDRYTLVEVHPVTGRHHQIRVQLSTIGSIIKGDLKYGAKRSNPDGSICLHAAKLSFTHPVSKQPITISASPPETNLWKAFNKIQNS